MAAATRSMRTGVMVALGLVLPALAAAEETGSEVTFAPHRAVYEVTLDRAAPGSGVAEMTGRMVYELTGSACEGWTQNMRFVTRMINQEGTAQLNDLRTSSWEDGRARALRFNSTQLRDDMVAEAAQGDAKRSPDDRAVKVDLAKPEKKSVSLSGQVYFPIQHSIELVRAARAGRTSFAAELYDGADKGEKVNPTNAVIGAKIQPGAVKSPAAVKNADKLDALASWPMAISYFEPGTDRKDSLPSYELGFRFYENGVSTRLHIDYGEFAINGELKDLVFLEAAKCAPDANAPGDKH